MAGQTGWTRAAILVAAVGLGLAVLDAVAGADNSRWGANYFPNVSLTTQDGKEVRFYEDLLKGKIVAINLIYTTCKYSCPLETAKLAQVQRLLGDRMGKDVFFYSITIDPDYDTPPVLKEYAGKYGAGRGWLFLTGKAADIENISKKLGLYTRPEAGGKDGHKPALLVGNEATGQWMRNSALDNPRYLARIIGEWMTSWKDAKPSRSYEEAKPLEIDAGQTTFTRRCAPCHSIGGGRIIGPDLAGVTRSRDRQWLARFIADPQRMLAERDPATVALFEDYRPLQMPGFGMSLEEATAIIEYIERQGAAASRPAVAPEGARGAPGSAGIRPPEASPPEPPFDTGSVLPPYLEIQEALSSDTLRGVAESARRIAGSVAASGEAGRRLHAAALRLAAAGDLATARNEFASVGDTIMAAARAAGTVLAAGVRVAYCPMVRRYWLQRGEQIRNPFHGKEMLECGRLVAGLPDLRDEQP